MAAASGVKGALPGWTQDDSYRIRRSGRAERGFVTQPSLERTTYTELRYQQRELRESATLPEGRKADRYPVSGRVGTGERTRELPGETPGIFIVLSGFATSDLSVYFVMLVRGGAYRKNACRGLLPVPGLWSMFFPALSLILWITVLPFFVSQYRSPQSNDRA